MNPSLYMNMGVMVLQPSLSLYSELIAKWRDGSHGLYYSREEVGDTDVLMEVCIVGGHCGPVIDLDACLYNHGSWLPGTVARECDPAQVVARHNFRAVRERDLADLLHTAMLRGTCRAHASLASAEKSCWDAEFSREVCCSPTTHQSPWGDPRCWADGLTFERCCMGFNDAELLKIELLHVGHSWYGFSSIPDRPSTDWFSQRCWRRYSEMRITLAAFSSTALHGDEDWPSPSFVESGHACQGMRAPALKEDTTIYVLFRLHLNNYFKRFAGHRVVSKLQRAFVNNPSLHLDLNRFGVCVPRLCCALQPNGVVSSFNALLVVLWESVVISCCVKLLEELPRPLLEDFEDVYAVDASDLETRHPVYRA